MEILRNSVGGASGCGEALGCWEADGSGLQSSGSSCTGTSEPARGSTGLSLSLCALLTRADCSGLLLRDAARESPPSSA